MSKSFVGFSVSTVRSVQYVFNGLSILYCKPWFSEYISSLVNLIFVAYFGVG